MKFLAWHSREPLVRPDIQKRLALLGSFATLSDHEMIESISANGHTGMVIWTLDDRISRRFVSREAGLGVASFPPYGMSRLLDIDRCRSVSHAIDDLTEILVRNPERIRWISPPVSIVRHDDCGTITVLNDVRALAEVYEQRTGSGLSVWSNMLGAIPLFTGMLPFENQLAASLRAVFSYYPRLLTPIEGVHRLGGATQIRARDADEEPRRIVQEQLLLGELAGQMGQPFSLKETRRVFLDNLSMYLREARFFFDMPIRQGLTGGRDSRLLLAGLLELDEYRDIEYFTNDAMSQDVELAGKVVEKVKATGRTLSWSISTRSPSGYARENDERAVAMIAGLQGVDEKNPLLARFLWHFHGQNGQVMPGAYYRSPGFTFGHASGSESQRIVLSGVSGETLRAPRYTLKSIASGRSLFMEKVIRSRFGASRNSAQLRKEIPVSGDDEVEYTLHGNRPYNIEATRAAIGSWSGYLAEALEWGIDDFRMFDYFAIAAQQSRRIGLGRRYEEVCPLASGDLLNQAFRLSPESRSTSEFHMMLIGDMVPELMDVPFSHQVKVEEREIRRDNSRFPPVFDEVEGVPGFRSILQDSELWNDAFDVKFIDAVFTTGRRQVNAYQKDRIACQLVWRAANTHYVEMLRRHAKG